MLEKNHENESYLLLYMKTEKTSLIALLVLSGIDFCNNLFQLTFSFTLWKIVHIVVLGGSLDQPLWFDVRHRPNVIFGG